MAKKQSKSPPNSSVPPPVAMNEGGGDERLMTTRELMEFLNLSRTKIWSLINEEGMPAFKLGGDYRFRKSEIVAWLENYRVRSSE